MASSGAWINNPTMSAKRCEEMNEGWGTVKHWILIAMIWEVEDRETIHTEWGTHSSILFHLKTGFRKEKNDTSWNASDINYRYAKIDAYYYDYKWNISGAITGGESFTISNQGTRGIITEIIHNLTNKTDERFDIYRSCYF